MRLPLLAAAVALTAPLSALALDIKGVQADRPLDCKVVESIHGTIGQVQACIETTAPLHLEVNFLDSRSKMAIHRTEAGIVTVVLVMGFDFNDAVDALTLKFGKPKLTRSTLQNRMGAKFEQTEASWYEGQRSLRVLKHGHELGKPVMTLTGSAFAENFERERAKKAAAAASNI